MADSRGYVGPIRTGRFTFAIAVAALCALPAPAFAAKPLGGLTQFPGSAGCISFTGASEDGAGTCGNGRAIEGVATAVTSADGKNLYVSSYRTGADADESIAIFKRDSATGALSQLSGTDGCLTPDGASEDGAGTCANGRAVGTGDPASLVISPDGKFVYAVSQYLDAVVSFGRNTTTGKLTQFSGLDACISIDGASEDGAGTCTNGRALDQPSGIAISRDGKHVYLSTYGTYPGLTIFSRNTTTGKLTQLSGTDGCITLAGDSEDGAATCVNGRAINNPGNVVVTSDGKSVYTAGYSSDSVALFRRDATTGKLTQLGGTDGCVSTTGASEDGAGTCTNGRALDGAYLLVASANPDHVYLSSYDSHAVNVFRRDPTTSKLTQLAGKDGCISLDGSSEDGANTCANGRALNNPYLPTLSLDGMTLYVPTYGSDSVAVFRRDKTTGKLQQLPGKDGCLSTTGASEDGAGTCANARTLGGAYSVAIAPGGRDVYVAAQDESDAIALFGAQLPPTCSNASRSIAHATPTALSLPCSDPNGDALTASIVQGPAHGSLGSVASNAVTYTPGPFFAGADLFTFKASDGALSSNTAGFDLTVAPDTVKPTCDQSARVTARASRTLKVKPKLRSVLKKGAIRFKLTCSEPVSLVAQLLLDRKSAKKLKIAASKTVVIGKGKKTLAANKNTTVKVKLKRKARKRLKKVRGRRKVRRLKLKLKITVTDVAGNQKKLGGKLKLKG